MPFSMINNLCPCLPHNIAPVVAHRSKRSLLDFYHVIKCTVPFNTPILLAYSNYGCYCGYGGSGTPVDALDRYSTHPGQEPC